MISFSTFTTCLPSDLRLPAACALRRKTLDGLQHRALIGDDRFAQRARPVEIGAHHLHDVGVVQQRLHRVVPLVVDGKLGIGLALVEKAIRLHELQRIGRRRQDDRDQVVRIERDRADELRRAPRRRAVARPRRMRPAPARRHSSRRRAGRCPPAVRASGTEPRRSAAARVRKLFIMRAPGPVCALRVPATDRDPPGCAVGSLDGVALAFEARARAPWRRPPAAAACAACACCCPCCAAAAFCLRLWLRATAAPAAAPAPASPPTTSPTTAPRAAPRTPAPGVVPVAVVGGAAAGCAAAASRDRIPSAGPPTCSRPPRRSSAAAATDPWPDRRTAARPPARPSPRSAPASTEFAASFDYPPSAKPGRNVDGTDPNPRGMTRHHPTVDHAGRDRTGHFQTFAGYFTTMAHMLLA